MNKLFKSPRKLLSYALLITATIMALGVIIVAFFGFNKSYQFGGYYEINIDYLDMEKKDEYLNGIDEILGTYGYTIDHYSVNGEKAYTPTLCIRYESTSEEDAKSIKADIIKKFSIDEKSTLLSVDKMSATYVSQNFAYILIPVCVALAILFLYGWIRKNILYGVAQSIAYTSTIIVGLSLFAVSRTMVSLSSLTLLFVSALLSSAVFTYYSSVTYSKKNSIHADNKELSEVFCDSINSSKAVMGIPALVLFAIFVGLTFTFNHSLMHIGFAGMICLFAVVWSAIILTGAYFVSVVSIANNKAKRVMSRNNNSSK